MLSRSHSFSLPAQKADHTSDNSVSMAQRLGALEAELAASQRLVCQLLEKNELLRMQLQSYKQELTVCLR